MKLFIKVALKWTFRFLLFVFIGAFVWGFIAYWRSTNNCGRRIPDGAEQMKAIQYCEYGPPDQVLKIEQVQKPVPNDNQILVRVRAVSLRFYDGGMLEGGIGRLIFGLRKPKNTTPGSDFSGTVEAVGRNVTEFKRSDEVFGVRAGCLAEYICVTASRAVVSKPGNVTFEQAATIPTALVALQGLRDTGRVKPGQKVLINGASGGVGTFAVQIAKAFGAEVTGVCSTRNVDRMHSINADHVIDYSKEDFTQNGQQYDFILAANGYRPFSDYQRALNSGGNYVMTGGATAQMFEAMFLGPLVSVTANKKMGNVMAKPNKENLAFMKELLE